MITEGLEGRAALQPFEPGELPKARFALPEVFRTPRPGHRLLVQVSNTWFALVARNPQTRYNIYKAEPRPPKADAPRVPRRQAPVARHAQRAEVSLP